MKHVFAARVSDDLSYVPYRVRVIEDKRFITERSARNYCKRVHGTGWELPDEKSDKNRNSR